jgi:hypothetical protein
MTDESWFDPRLNEDISLSFKVSGTGEVYIRPPVHWLHGDHSSVVKRPEREAND